VDTRGRGVEISLPFGPPSGVPSAVRMPEAPPPTLPQPGDLVAGKYRVERMLGSGGMGCVLAAEHTVLRTRVALKLLLPLAAAIPGATERFLREARAVGALRSDHVAHVIDVGHTESGAPFLVMEHLVGQDLRKVVRERGALPVREAVDYLAQICDAVREAHEKGIVHRDLKPGNVFLTARPNGEPIVKVLDFGLAKVLDPLRGEAPEESITQTDLVLGSPHYMSPEQFRSLRNADARSDIWAIGVIAYELLAGRRPFFGEGMSGVMMSVVTERPDSLAEMRPELPPALVALIDRCLEKSPDKRPQSVDEIAFELTAIRRALPVGEASGSLGAVAEASGSLGASVAAKTSVEPAPGMQGVLPPAPGRSTWRMVDLSKETPAQTVAGDTHKGVSVSPEEAWADAAHVRRARQRATRRKWLFGGALVAMAAGGALAFFLTHAGPEAGAGPSNATAEAPLGAPGQGSSSAGVVVAPGQGTSSTGGVVVAPGQGTSSGGVVVAPGQGASSVVVAPGQDPSGAPSGTSGALVPVKQAASSSATAPSLAGSRPPAGHTPPAPGAKKASPSDPFGKYE